MEYQRIGKNGSKVKGKRAAGIMFTDGKKMLLLKRSDEGDHPKTWSLPAGKSKEHESDIDTAVREVKEETGLSQIPGYRFDTLSFQNGHQKFTAFLYMVKEPFDINLSAEHSESKWVEFNDLAGLPLHPSFRAELPDYLRKVRKKAQSFSEWASVMDAILLLS